MFLHLTRSRAVVARKAHNLEVVCSIHTSATIEINPRRGFYFTKNLRKNFSEYNCFIIFVYEKFFKNHFAGPDFGVIFVSIWGNFTDSRFYFFHCEKCFCHDRECAKFCTKWRRKYPKYLRNHQKFYSVWHGNDQCGHRECAHKCQSGRKYDEQWDTIHKKYSKYITIKEKSEKSIFGFFYLIFDVIML